MAIPRVIVIDADPEAVVGVAEALRRAGFEIAREFGDRQIRLGTVARRLAISASRLTSVLRRQTGVGFGAHLHAQRVREAARLLAETSLSVKEVAWQVGYTSTMATDTLHTLDTRSARTTLDTIANLVFVVTCVGLLGLASYRTFDHPDPASAPAGARGGVVTTGMKISGLAGLAFGESATTVALVVSSQCHFCAESIPFYRRLAALRRAGRVQIVAASLEPRVSMQVSAAGTQAAVSADLHAALGLATLTTARAEQTGDPADRRAAADLYVRASDIALEHGLVRYTRPDWPVSRAGGLR